GHSRDYGGDPGAGQAAPRSPTAIGSRPEHRCKFPHSPEPAVASQHPHIPSIEVTALEEVPGTNEPISPGPSKKPIPLRGVRVWCVVLHRRRAGRHSILGWGLSMCPYRQVNDHRRSGVREKFSAAHAPGKEVVHDPKAEEEQMAHSRVDEYQIRIARADGTEELTRWMESEEQLAQAMAAVQATRRNLLASGAKRSLCRPLGSRTTHHNGMSHYGYPVSSIRPPQFPLSGGSRIEERERIA